MRFFSRRSRAPGSALLFTAAIVGCDSTPASNLSPTAERDPERYQRAVHESEQKARKDQDDERKAFQAKGRNSPNP